MSHAFNGKAGLIYIEAEVSGPMGKASARLILDTGATSSTLNVNLLRSVGYDPAGATDFVQMATGSAVVLVPRLILNRLGALGRHAIGLRILAHDLPSEAAADGLLGLDFFRGLSLLIDFRSEEITLA